MQLNSTQTREYDRHKERCVPFWNSNHNNASIKVWQLKRTTDKITLPCFRQYNLPRFCCQMSLLIFNRPMEVVRPKFRSLIATTTVRRTDVCSCTQCTQTPSLRKRGGSSVCVGSNSRKGYEERKCAEQKIKWFPQNFTFLRLYSLRIFWPKTANSFPK